jgi:hypothetical protein
MYERATIIMEMEQSMLPLVTAFKRWYFFAHYRYQQLKRKVMGRGVRAAGNGGSVSASSQGDRLPLEDEDAETAASAWKAQVKRLDTHICAYSEARRYSVRLSNVRVC